MRRLVLIALLALTCALARPAHAVDQFASYNGSCEQGGSQVTTNGVQSDQPVQLSYPSCTVTVFAHGSVTPYTPLFSDAAGTIPLANPFTSSATTGRFQFYAANGRYDVQLSAAPVNPPLVTLQTFAISDIILCFNCGGGGGGSVSNVSGTAGQITVINPTSTPVISLANPTIFPGPVQFPGSSSGSVTLKSQAIAGTWTLQLPANGGSSGNCLGTDGTGLTSWITCGGGGGGGTPGNPLTSLQYNNGGSFAGATPTTFNASTGQLDINNIANIRYATTALNWSQTIAGTLTGGSPATVTLTPCPIGIDGRDTISYVYISGIGTPEPVQLTGSGSCTSGLASGTIKFTPLNNHSTGYTIGSGSQGIQETINQAVNHTGTGGSADVSVVIEPAGMPIANGNIANYYLINAPITNGGVNDLTLIGDGAVLGCNTRDYCIFATGTMVMKGFRMASNVQVNGWSITNVSCTAGVATITTSASHGFITGDFVDIHDTDDGFYWGGSVSQGSRITVTAANTFTYPIKSGNCAAGGGSTRASLNTPGTTNILNAAYFGGVNGITGSSLTGLSLDIPGGNSSVFTGHFNNGVVVMDDEAFRLRDFMGGSLNSKSSPPSCSVSFPYCGALVYAPGPFSGGSGILWITDSDLTAQCTGNPVVAFNGNTVHLSNVIAQSQAKFAVQASSRRGGFGNVILDNVYDEQGNCTNPDSGLAASTGYAFYGNAARVSGGEGPQGNIPQLVGGGGQQFKYFLVPNNGTTDAMPLYFANAFPTGPFSGQFPRIMPTIVGTSSITYTQPTYSIIRTIDTANVPTTAACGGGSPTACGTIITGATQCTTLWCPFSDDPSASTTAVTVNFPSAYVPDATFWPGAFWLNGGATMWLDTNVLIPGGAIITNFSNGPASNSTYTLRNTGQLYSWVTGFSTGPPATIFQDSSTTAGLKGTLNIIRTINVNVRSGEILTLIDSNPVKTLANVNKRPAQDAADTYFGNDLDSVAPTAVGLAIGAPVAQSHYINTTPDGISWLERLTAGLKEFNVNTQFDQPMLSFIGCTGCGPFNRTTAYINDTFNRALAGTLGANWTTLLGTWSIVQGSAFPHPYADFTATTVESGNPRAYAYYSGTSFNNDQWAQSVVQGQNNLVGICIRMTNSAPLNAYCFLAGNVSSTYGKFVAGTYTQFGVLPGVASPTVVKLQAQGTTITVAYNGVQQATQTDTAVTAGSPGVVGENTVVTTQGLSNFYAGNTGWTATEPLTVSKIVSQGNPAISTGTASNTDLNGELAFTGGTTSASYSFIGTYISTPVCVGSPKFDYGVHRLWISTLTTATLQFSSDAAQTGTMEYQCTGRN